MWKRFLSILAHLNPRSSSVGRHRLVLSPFVRSLFVLAAGSASAKIITLLSLPILTRLYQPEDFGVLALFTSIVSVAAPIATLRFNQAMPLARSEQSAVCLAALSLLGTIMLALMLVPVGLIASQWPAISSVIGPLLPYWPLVLAGLLVTASFDIVYYAGIRHQLNKQIAQAFFARAILGTVVKLGAGAIGFGPMGLVTGQILQLSGGSTLILFKIRRGLRQRLAKLSWRALRATARSYRAYPTIIMPSSLVVALGMQAPIFMMATLYDARTVGHFAFATAVVAVPINLLQQTIGNAYYGEISRIKRCGHGSIAMLTLKLIAVLLSIGLVFAVVTYLLAEPVAAFVLGKEWGIAGSYMSYIAIYAGAQIASAPLAKLFLLTQRHLLFAFIGSVRLGIVACVWYVLREMQISADSGILILSLAFLAFYSGVIIFLLIELSAIRVVERGAK